MSRPALTAAGLKAQAARLGFDACAIAPALDDWPPAARLDTWLDLGRHGEMAYMAQTAARRRSPKALWPEAVSAVMVGVSYAPAADPLTLLAARGQGALAAYATRRDYHEVIKGRLKTLAQQIARHGPEVKVFVDTAPLMEKPLAQLAGLGWQGKHTNLVSRQHGSWLLLGTILTTAALDPDPPEPDHCGSCRACLDVCPTGAFPAPYQLDARRCLAYLSIEHQGPIPEAFRRPMGNRVFGCDDCLAVCPWNKFAADSHMMAEQSALQGLPLAQVATLTDDAFRRLFAGTPVKRTGRDRFVRNVLIAIGNSGDASFSATAQALLDDQSPLVRGMAVWALAQLLDADHFAALKLARAGAEPDSDVKGEWARGTGRQQA